MHSVVVFFSVEFAIAIVSNDISTFVLSVYSIHLYCCRKWEKLNGDEAGMKAGILHIFMYQKQ